MDSESQHKTPQRWKTLVRPAGFWQASRSAASCALGGGNGLCEVLHGGVGGVINCRSLVT